jgi:hypothetical protein
VFPLTFDMRGWQQTRDNIWVNQEGDGVILDYFDKVPDIPGPLEDVEGLRRLMVQGTAASGAALVELDVVGLDGLAALRQIVKVPLPDQPSGAAYLASFIVPRAACSVTMRLQCREHGTTGMRDAIAMNHFMEHHASQGLALEEIMKVWTRHPYGVDVELPGGLPRNRSDDEGWDPHFPDHPLSRARRTQLALAQTIRLDPGFKALPPFRGPGA